MSRRIILFIFIVGLTAAFFLKPQSKSHDVLGMPNFTVVTRTSTPEPQPPTSTPDNSKPNPTSRPPDPDSPTATPIAVENTATPTLVPVRLVETPLGGFLPTAVACGTPATAQAKNTTRVRSGPGTEYGIVGELVYLEVRPIVGRAVDSEWWIIQFSNKETGWIANAVVTVQGNTSGIPAIAAPLLNGATTTPGPQWQPTVNPVCPTATKAATQTAVPTQTATPLPTKTATPMPTALTQVTGSAIEAETSPTSVVPTVVETAVTQQAPPIPTAPPLTNNASPAKALPCAPALLGLAVIGFLGFRRIF